LKNKNNITINHTIKGSVILQVMKDVLKNDYNVEGNNIHTKPPQNIERSQSLYLSLKEQMNLFRGGYNE
jgi:predicted small secreted protein